LPTSSKKHGKHGRKGHKGDRAGAATTPPTSATNAAAPTSAATTGSATATATATNGRVDASPATNGESARPDTDELRALFQEFVKEKKAAGGGDVDVDFDAFAETIRSECDRLIAEHKCRGVRFEVAVAEGEVSLRPRLLR
jgi:hypothetical protein